MEDEKVEKKRGKYWGGKGGEERGNMEEEKVEKKGGGGNIEDGYWSMWNLSTQCKNKSTLIKIFLFDLERGLKEEFWFLRLYLHY